MNWKGQTVVVTGGAGFIGSHLVDLLVSLGAHVLIYDDLRRPGRQNIEHMLDCGKVRLVGLDLSEVLPAFPYKAPVFHLAARVTNIHANRRDHLGMLQDNLRINTNVVGAIRESRPSVAVLVSTVCVYPHAAPVPTPENAGYPLHPEDTNEGYGLAKGILEKQGEYLHRELGIPVVVPRFSNAIGLRDYYDKGSSHVVPALIRRIEEGEYPLRVWGTGNQTRVFVDARELATALVALADCPEAHDARPVNIGHDCEISMLDLARLIAEACGKPDLRIVPDTSYPDGHLRRAVDNHRLESLIGWVPDMPLAETIGDMVAEYRSGRAHV